jgi:branched-subunit amino acid aminotransferase/4-amino-4-deoxychorismate lyase
MPRPRPLKSQRDSYGSASLAGGAGDRSFGRNVTRRPTGSSATTHEALAQARGPRPDPALGVFETLLVLDGWPLELEAHLARLDASLRAVFGAPAPATARELVLDHARGADVARLRLTIAPDDQRGLTAAVVVAPVDAALVLPGPDRGLDLAPLVVAGGIGAHKWADRRLLASAEAEVAPRVPLLLDRDGAVLEASRGNLFLVHDGVLVTPPADGRILPGVTRRRVIELAAALGIPVREEAVPFDRLRQAAELFLTGAVRGIEPVVGPEEETTAALSRELRRFWSLEHHLPRRGGAVDAPIG